LPDRAQIRAVAQTELQPIEGVNDGHISWFLSEFEQFTRRQELERAIRKHDLDPETDLPLIKQALLEQDGTVTIIHKSEHKEDRHHKTIGKLPGKE
jgi:uncharacterized membrane protein YcaP (DUF421 family)